MAEVLSEELVNQIVQRVLAKLAQEPSGPANSVPDASGGEVRKQAEAAPQAPSGRVWVTAGMLAERAGGGSEVVLAPNEQLTPAAGDYASSRCLDVRRGGAAAGPRPLPATVTTGGRVSPAALTRTLGLVANRPDAKAEAALAAAGRAGTALRGFGEADSWMANARAMCQAVASGELAGGVIVDRYAAAPLILAAKIKGIRPVQGVSVAAVEAGLRQFDANVLVIGHATASVYEIRSMIDRFAAGRRMGRDRTLLLDTVEQLEGRPEA